MIFLGERGLFFKVSLMNPDRFDEIYADLNHFKHYPELHPEFNNNNN